MLYSLTYMSNLKNQAISLHNSTETVIERQIGGCQKGKRWGGRGEKLVREIDIQTFSCKINESQV